MNNKRQRSRLLDELQRDEEAYRLYQSLMSKFKGDETTSSDSDEDDRSRTSQRRRNEYCLVKVIYRNPYNRRRRRTDEITIVQHHRIVFKGCLKDGDRLTFKSHRYRHASKLRWKFYINDVLEEEKIACCEYGLMDRNRPAHLFQIDNVVGAKPCYDCEFQDDTSEALTRNFEENPPETNNSTAASESSNYHTEPHNQCQFDEDSMGVVSASLQSPARRTYGPPQLSIVEPLDPLSPNIRESILSTTLPFNSAANPQQETIPQVNPNEQEASSNSNNVAMVNDAVQLLLARLGVMRQEQVERSHAVRVVAPREKGNVESFLIVYLHPSYPEESVVTHLRGLVNYIKVFDDSDDCIAFINTVANEKILLILSSSLHQEILPRIEELQQVFTSYIQAENGEPLDLPGRKSKVQGVYLTTEEIYEQLSIDVKKIQRDLVIYLNISCNSLSLDDRVAYYLLLSEIILDPSGMKNNMKELVSFSRQEYEGNEEELQIIDEFESKYRKDQAISWFSRPCFLSKMLHKALWVAEPDVLFRLRSFVQDLFQQIQNESASVSITAYLGQTIQRKDLDDLENNILTNDMLIFPQFLFATTDYDRAIRIANDIPVDGADCIPLVICIDIAEDLKCANLNSHLYADDVENNVLLNMGMMGRIVKVERSEDQLASLHLRAVKAEEQRNFQQVLETSRAVMKSSSPFSRLIKLMSTMHQQTSAEHLVQMMCEDEMLKSDAGIQGSIAASCHDLAHLRRDEEDYQRALDLYLLSLNVFLRIMSPKATELSALYSSIGLMYFRLENDDKSQEFYHIALDTELHSNTPDLYSVSNFTNRLGIIYTRQEKYPEAIKYFERTLKILQQCSEPHDVELLLTYGDLGDVYIASLKYNEALENYRKALQIQERIAVRNPQVLGTLYQMIGNICIKLGQTKEALSNLKRALESFEEILPANHSTFALLYNNIGLMYYREEQYADALRCYSKTLEIAAISLPENHSLVGITLHNTALTYASEEKFDEAIECFEKSIKQFLKTLPEDHPDVLENKTYIESMRQKKVLKDIFDENTMSF